MFIGFPLGTKTGRLFLSNVLLLNSIDNFHRSFTHCLYSVLGESYTCFYSHIYLYSFHELYASSRIVPLTDCYKETLWFSYQGPILRASWNLMLWIATDGKVSAFWIGNFSSLNRPPSHSVHNQTHWSAASVETDWNVNHFGDFFSDFWEVPSNKRFSTFFSYLFIINWDFGYLTFSSISCMTEVPPSMFTHP